MNAIIFGTGEYVTGWTGQGGSKSDKALGVVGLVHFDLRERGLIGSKIALCGTNGNKFKDIRNHFDEKIGKAFKNLPNLSFEAFPNEGEVDSKAYLKCLEEFSKPGDVCSVFTPDSSHYEICKAALQKGLHVIATKPMVKTLKEHIELVELAKEKGVLLQIEVHKRFDPIYSDAVMRIKDLGDFNYFVSYMSQPKFQLETFRAWAGIDSDISYYLNSHHVDLHVWSMQGKARVISVRANATEGVIAEKILERPCEDTITLTAVWENLKEGENGKKSKGHAVYTASWTAAKSDVHSQQRFFCLMEKGEVTADQCHRNYTVATDETNGLSSLNPLYIRNVPDFEGNYCGQNGYGYISFEKFVKAAKAINDGEKKAEEFDRGLPTGNVTKAVTAILEGGRRSLDDGGREVRFVYEEGDIVGME